MKGKHKAILEIALVDVLTTLTKGESLAEKYRDHALTGEWNDHRDCHIKPDLVLIYRKPNNEVLQLVRLGSHSELGL
ncbi:MAG: type II toxin-antitoxin system YafQ family toxin [Ectothiorhodospiraceae bacterium]|nr:type II toxin-antitoxin system YafQ family toxin [Ectothiorhodospiraceae bacterium]